MRVLASRYLRVRVGDDVLVRARLSVRSSLARLHVFAKDQHDDRMSPYVLGAGMIAGAVTSSSSKAAPLPQMATPLMLRLTDKHPVKALRFKADINGYICIMQEVDVRQDPRARVVLRRNPDLPWHMRWLDSLRGLWPARRHRACRPSLESGTVSGRRRRTAISAA
jgi:hypothetical protein